MRAAQTIITFRAFNIIHSTTVDKRLNLVEADNHIYKEYGDTCQLIKIQIGDTEIFNPDYKPFEIETIRSNKLINKK